MRCWPTESKRAKAFCAVAMVVVVELRDEVFGRAPGLRRRLADDDVEADAEGQGAPLLPPPAALATAIFSATSAGGSPQVR